jgi:hypothetical protein
VSLLLDVLGEVGEEDRGVSALEAAVATQVCARARFSERTVVARLSLGDWSGGTKLPGCGESSSCVLGVPLPTLECKNAPRLQGSLALLIRTTITDWAHMECLIQPKCPTALRVACTKHVLQVCFPLQISTLSRRILDAFFLFKSKQLLYAMHALQSPCAVEDEF